MKKTIYMTLAAIGGVAIIGLSFSTANLNSKLHDSDSQLAKVTSDLDVTKAQLAKTTIDLEESNKKISEIRGKISDFKDLEQKILVVLNEEERSRKSHFDGRNANPSEYRHYFSEIRGIKIDDCPPDFRDAWRDFLAAVEFKIEHPVLSSGEKRSEWPSDKRRDLETIAAKYGVKYRVH